MKKIIVLFLMITLTISCNKSTKKADTSLKSDVKKDYNTDSKYIVPDSIAEYLISACVSDIKKQKHLSNIQFRQSRVGYNVSKNKEKHYFLCGEFKADPEQVWIPFATLKTEGYEQWQGGQSLTFCQDSTIIWNDRNFSKLIQEKLTSR
jgi:hypothetical protein